jgi:hypothetical protein
LSGGNDKTTFYLSGGLYKSQSAQKGVNYDRITTKLALTHKATSRLSINGNVGLSYQKANTTLDAGAFANPIRSLYRLQPWLKIYNPDGSYDFSYNNSSNPVAVIDKNLRRAQTYSVLSTVGGAYDIYKGLSFETKAGADVNYAQTNLFYAPGFGDGRNNGGLAEQTGTLYFNWISTNILKYKTQFGDDHKLNVLAGYEAQKTTVTGNDARASNLLPGSELLVNASKPELASSTDSANAINSIISSANYSFKNKYNVSASFRRDGSSRFGSAKRYGNFWAGGAAWVSVAGAWSAALRFFARAGTVTSIVGGSAEDLTTARPALGAMGSQIEHVGDIGAGTAVKMANQVLLTVSLLAAREVAELARAQGVSTQRLWEVLRTCTGTTWVVENWPTVAAWLDRTHPPLDILVKDTGLALDLVRELTLPARLIPLSAQMVRELANSLAR